MAGRRFTGEQGGNANTPERRASSQGRTPAGNRGPAGSKAPASGRRPANAPKTQGRSSNSREYQDGYHYNSRNGAEPRGARAGQFEDLSSYSNEREYKTAKSGHKSKHKGLKVFLITFCVLILLVGGGVIFVSSYLLNGITSEPITKNPEELGIAPDNVYEQEAAGSVTNYALFGTDDRSDDVSGRSDAVMVLSVDAKHNKIKLISILRDSYVSINGSMDKLNHAYAYGGAELAVKTLNENFGLNIKDYATVNFTRLAKVVNAFGGTNVTITDVEMEQINLNMQGLVGSDEDVTISDSDYMTQSGDVVLNGNQAVAYARIRITDSDDERAKRQQNVIKGMLGRLTSLGATDYANLIREVAPLTITSVDVGDVLPMIPFAMGGFSMETYNIPGELDNATGGLINGTWYYSYDLDLAAQHIDAIIREQDSPYYSTYFGDVS